MNKLKLKRKKLEAATGQKVKRRPAARWANGARPTAASEPPPTASASSKWNAPDSGACRRSCRSAAASDAQDYKFGDAVSAWSDDSGAWYDAIITKVHGGRKFSIAWADGSDYDLEKTAQQLKKETGKSTHGGKGETLAQGHGPQKRRRRQGLRPLQGSKPTSKPIVSSHGTVSIAQSGMKKATRVQEIGKKESEYEACV